MTSSTPEHRSLDKLLYSPTTQHRGLENRIGENNCFLNVTIQALWHVNAFRTHMFEYIAALEICQQSPTIKNNSLLASLCSLFTQYQFTEYQVLPPNELRECLGKLSSHFQLGKIADANEVFEVILNRIHEESRHICPTPLKCLSHAVFGNTIAEQSKCCDCRSTSEPNIRSFFLNYFHANEIIKIAKDLPNGIQLIPLEPIQSSTIPKRISMKKQFQSFVGFKRQESLAKLMDEDLHQQNTYRPLNYLTNTKALLFGRILQRCMRSIGLKDCPSNEDTSFSQRIPCKGKASVYYTPIDYPLSLAISLSWSNPQESIENIHIFLSLISHTLYINDIYGHEELNHPIVNSLNEPQTTSGISYLFTGMVCYYGLHYVSIFHILDQETEEMTFVLFDDRTVRSLGDWKSVVNHCIQCRYQPVLLLYELEASNETMGLKQSYSNNIQEYTAQAKASNTSKASNNFFTLLSESMNEVKEGAKSLQITTSSNRSEDDDWVQIDNKLKSDHKEESKVKDIDNKYHSNDDIRSMKQESYSAVVTSFNRRLSRYNVILPLTYFKDEVFLGLYIETEKGTGAKRVVEFNRHPLTKAQMPAELCGYIHLMDRVMTVNGKDVSQCSMDEFIKKIKETTNNSKIIFEFESSYDIIYSFICPLCRGINEYRNSNPLFDIDYQEKNKYMKIRWKESVNSTIKVIRCQICNSSLDINNKLNFRG